MKKFLIIVSLASLFISGAAFAAMYEVGPGGYSDLETLASGGLTGRTLDGGDVSLMFNNLSSDASLASPIMPAANGSTFLRMSDMFSSQKIFISPSAIPVSFFDLAGANLAFLVESASSIELSNFQNIFSDSIGGAALSFGEA